MPKFGAASERQLATCHPDLQRVARRVVEFWDCSVLEGKRSEAQQKLNVAKGVSKTLDSKHVYPLDSPSLAMDLAPYPIRWRDDARWYAFAGFVIGVAFSLGVKLRWGGDWDSDRDFHDQDFFDFPHFELIT